MHDLVSRARTGAALTLATMLSAAPAAPAAVVPVEVLYLVPERQETVRTRRTSPDVAYTIMVTGAVSYNGRGSIYDCGHWESPREGGWGVWNAPLLDGEAPPCADMPVHESHTYCWAQQGTGHQLTFSIDGDDVHKDDNGGFVIMVERVTGGVSSLPCPVLDT